MALFCAIIRWFEQLFVFINTSQLLMLTVFRLFANDGNEGPLCFDRASKAKWKFCLAYKNISFLSKCTRACFSRNSLIGLESNYNLNISSPVEQTAHFLLDGLQFSAPLRQQFRRLNTLKHINRLKINQDSREWHGHSCSSHYMLHWSLNHEMPPQQNGKI